MFSFTYTQVTDDVFEFICSRFQSYTTRFGVFFPKTYSYFPCVILLITTLTPALISIDVCLIQLI